MFCDLCLKVYSTRKNISKHMENVHGSKRYSCNVCDFKTANKQVLERHKLIHGAKVECPICFKIVAVLKTHMISNKLKECCVVCQKIFSAGKLKRHMKTHDRPHKCRSCDEAFEIKGDLRR